MSSKMQLFQGLVIVLFQVALSAAAEGRRVLLVMGGVRWGLGGVEVHDTLPRWTSLPPIFHRLPGPDTTTMARIR